MGAVFCPDRKRSAILSRVAASKQELGVVSTEVFLDEIFDAAARLEDEHEELLVLRGSGVHRGLGGWP